MEAGNSHLRCMIVIPCCTVADQLFCIHSESLLLFTLLRLFFSFVLLLASYLQLQRCRLLHKLVNAHKALLLHTNFSSKWVKSGRKRRTRIVLHIFSSLLWKWGEFTKCLAGITCVCVVPSADNVADNVRSASILCDVLNKKRTNWST